MKRRLGLFPEWLQTASLVVPTRWAVDRLDAMTWRGLGSGRRGWSSSARDVLLRRGAGAVEASPGTALA